MYDHKIRDYTIYITGSELNGPGGGAPDSDFFHTIDYHGTYDNALEEGRRINRDSFAGDFHVSVMPKKNIDDMVK